MVEPLLVAQRISVARGKRRTLEEISLALYPGEILALIGPNGAGKSTLLRAILGLIPSEGEVRCGRRSLFEMHERERAREIAYIPQEGLLTQGFLVEEVVAQGRYAHLGGRRQLSKSDWEAVRDALKIAQIEALIGRRYDRLSLGERRRVLIARALAGGAKILALDEPDASLDLAQKLALFELLRALRDEGYGVLIVLHGLEEMRALADRAILLSSGRAMAEGGPNEVLRDEALEEVYGLTLRGEPPRFERIGEPITIPSRTGKQEREASAAPSWPLVSLNLALLFIALLFGAGALIAKGRPSGGASVVRLSDSSGGQLEDHRGHAFSRGIYQRILSGSVTADQILAELIDPARVVGVTSYGQNFEPAAFRFAQHPSVDRLSDVERILALRPDLVIVNDVADEAALHRLRELEIPVFDLGPVHGAQKFAEDIRTLGSLLGEFERAEALASLYLSRLERIAARPEPGVMEKGRFEQAARSKRALYLRSFGRDLLGGASGTHYHDVIRYAGLIDAAEEFHGWPRYEAEQVLTLDPDFIVTAKGKGEVICASPGLERLRACRQRAIFEIDAALLDDSAFGVENAALALRRAYEAWVR